MNNIAVIGNVVFKNILAVVAIAITLSNTLAKQR